MSSSEKNAEIAKVNKKLHQSNTMIGVIFYAIE